MYFRLFSLMVSMLYLHQALGQAKENHVGCLYQFNAPTLGDSLEIEVFLPEGYKNSEK